MVLHQPDLGPAGLTHPLGSPATAPAPTGAVVGVDAALPTTKAADELARRIRDLLGDAVAPVIATHFVSGFGLPHVALTVDAVSIGQRAADLTTLDDLGAGLWTDGGSCGSADLVGGAEQAVKAYRSGHGGRAVCFAGSDAVPPEVTVAELLAGTAIDAVAVLSGGDIDPATVVLTRGHLRPTWTAGRLVLAVERAAGGRLVPFETPTPTPCCADHA
ncbi:MAG: hypothetical protein QOJ37_2796 [Pseudonocardiales bacterium]|nr:hypothetical protein [Pseudonocardiales bacterium]